MRGGILIKRVFDGIIGLAVGDALGVPVEFKTRAEIKNNPVIGMRGYGTHNQPIGTWSDDTSLTLALTDSLIKKRGLEAGSLAGIYYGAQTIPREWFDVIAKKQYIEKLCEDFQRMIDNQ